MKIHQQPLWQCQTQLLNMQISGLEEHPSLQEGQQGLWPGFAHSAMQTGGSPVNQNGHFPKGFSGHLQV